ncbi:hypothetical protein PoB_002230600 [Plakobranchus ocellatus]|uniref:Uncharacterized protein n=1 Tax=Plakobranchus ocellatus TaxID=259542 RepID=A0AAV3ZMQ8_9GAST|nr:hypothetical protein PoB_002230600 [Plakobranchus ocellatus]
MADIMLSRVRAPPPAPRPCGGPESLKSPCHGLARHTCTKKNISIKKQPSQTSSFTPVWGVGGTVERKPALRSLGTVLSRVRVPPIAPWCNGEPESLISPVLIVDRLYTKLKIDHKYNVIYSTSSRNEESIEANPLIPQQGDLRLSGPPSGQGACSGARTRDRRVPADLGADLLATLPPTAPAEENIPMVGNGGSTYTLRLIGKSTIRGHHKSYCPRLDARNLNI